MTNREGLFKNQARYLVEKRDMALWERVLSNENQYRRSLIDQASVLIGSLISGNLLLFFFLFFSSRNLTVRRWCRLHCPSRTAQRRSQSR